MCHPGQVATWVTWENRRAYNEIPSASILSARVSLTISHIYTPNMIQRIYINNYCCFENFDVTLRDKSSVLVIGKNGVGKSSLGSALEILQRVGRGSNRVEELVSREDYGQNRTEIPIRFELTVEIEERVFEYSLVLELPETFKESRVKAEFLKLDGELVFSRELGQVEIPKNDTKFLVDWHLVALPIIRTRENNDPIERFRSWLSKMTLLAPIPSLIKGHSSEETLTPEKDASNLAAWLSGLLSQYPASYTEVATYLGEVLTDFQDFENKPISENAKSLTVRFKHEKASLSQKFERLSDGEKCFFLCAVLLGANKFYGPIFCLWDEPDNYLSISEVGHLLVALRKSFEASGQLLVISHNPEAIRKFADENILQLDRHSHLEPPTARWLSELSYQGDLVESLIRGDVADVTE